MENLVLCHPPCNRNLGDRALVEKIEMRDSQREAAWKAAMRKRIAENLLP